jgi:pSer/pThr/pTyr-binding forkhead associated (FHA) protein
MSFLEIDGKRHAIPSGTSTIGSDGAGFIALSGDGITLRHLIVQGSPDGQTSVSRADDVAETFINGVKLGPQPTPLLHGDKIELGDHELIFVDERRSGSTQFVNADDLAKFRPPGGSKAAADPTAATGGRLVSLTDGREYEITGTIVIGRDAACEVVITSKRVSRRHAEIVATSKGYIVIDTSTNGTFVNGERVEGERVLARADIIRLGDDEFRFYADAAAQPVASTPGPGADSAPAGAEQRLGDTMFGVPGMGAAARAAAAGPPPGADYQLADTMHGVPGSSPPAAQPRESGSHALASLLVRSGDLKGRRFPIRVPVVNVGRADYNDIVVDDGTVSTIHAKFQRREGIWVLVDLDSTNGTFVDGERVSGEVPLAPGAIVRFGDVSMVFEPMDDTVDPRQGSSTKLMGAMAAPPPPPPAGTERSAPDKRDRATGDAHGRDSAPDEERERGFRIWPFK